MHPKTLIFIPTYNESGNVERMYQQLVALGLGADILFLDDNSPDGTGNILDAIAKKDPRVTVIHRPGKMGVGGAHLDGIAWAYDRNYDLLITLDCDFTHSPLDILKLLAASEESDVTVGSRFLQANSLPDWNLYRKFLTRFGHVLTRRLLKIEQDATGAFRIYRLKRIPRELFSLVQSRGYSFFFESLFLLARNKFSVREVPIVLPKRTYGESKMSVRDTFRSVQRLLSLYQRSLIRPEDFRLVRASPDDSALVDPQNWDAYWNKKSQVSNAIYEFIAQVYRNAIIRRQLNRAVRKTFFSGSHLLHAGCGSGQVDCDIQHAMNITAIDISSAALKLYRRHVPHATAVKHASIFCLPFADGTFDGVYNLGVMEHFTLEEIRRILAEFYRVLKSDGRLLLFWPHARATSVFVLDNAHRVLHAMGQKNVQLHPPEISRVQSREQMESLLAETNFRMLSYEFSVKDFWVQVGIVAAKK